MMEMLKTVSNVKQFHDVVLTSSQPVMVNFYAEWSDDSRELEATFLKLADEYRGRVHFVKVDVDKSIDLMRQYAIQKMPTVMLFLAGEADKIWEAELHRSAYVAKLDCVLQTHPGRSRA